MGSVNKVVLLGRLGRDPEIRMTQTGQQVANFSMATSESWTKNGVREEKTEWHNIIAWGKLAEIISKYVKKGSMLYVEGKLQTRSWEKNGEKRYTTEIVASDITFVESATKGDSAPASAPAATSPTWQDSQSYDPGPDPDVPF